jgi:hypothetical protein
MIFHQDFLITGVANDTVYDSGLEGTKKEPKHLISCLVQVSEYQNNHVEGWIEKTRIFDIKDKLIDTDSDSGGTNMQRSAQRINEIPVDVELGPGEIFKAAVRSGATPINLIGAYVYELKAA